jgi:CubicO group peptidase (beta-lactamase class C family)
MKTFIFILLFLSFGVLHAQDIQTIDQAISQADQIAQKTYNDEKFPGLAIAVLSDGKIVWSKGYGYADIENQLKVDPSRHLFRIGSISKSFTAVGLAQLYESGKIDLHAEVQKYVPYFPKKEWPVIVKEVAHHVAGIRHYRGFEFLNNEKYETIRQGVGIFENDDLLFEPGTKYQYSSYGWNLISAVMEGACECNFLDFMQKNVFKKGKLKNSFADHNDIEMPNRVQFYIQEEGVNKIAPSVDNSYKWAGGGFISTATDVAKFGHAVMHEKYTSAKTNQLFWTPYTLKNGKKTNYGLGWAVNEDQKGRPWVGHSGGSVGGTSMLLMYPEYDLVIVTLVNQSSAKMGNLAFRVANQFITFLEHNN